MDVDTKDKEILFLKDKLYQLQTQISILQKRAKKHQKKPRYTLRERLFILWHIETFGIARRKVTEHLGISRSTLYRWLHQIDDASHTRIPAVLSDDVVQITTIKRAEGNDDLVIRLFEPTGKARTTVLSLPFLNKKMNVMLAGFEIKTLRVNLRARKTVNTSLLEEPM